MLIKGKSWELMAAAKRSSTLAKIPKEWLLDPADLEKASRQRDLAGPFIEQYLSAEEIAIVRQDSVSIVTSIHKGEYSAVQVARAFCKVAAIAHQIVSSF
jgi:amidase